jgi:L,D-transpeptidase ErfK/SrfK
LARRKKLLQPLKRLLAAFALICLSTPAIAHDISQVIYYAAGPGETLQSIAQRFDLGIGELRSANRGVTNEGLKDEGGILALPAFHLLPAIPHEGIVINLAERRLYHFIDPMTWESFPVTIGKEGWETPTGTTYIVRKRADPTWIPPDKIRAEDPNLPAFIGPGPDNPLGKYALDLGWDGFRIHGTNNPSSIGKQSSHGCIRMYPADIERLFNGVSEKEKVTVINVPYKLAWRDNTLFLEVTPPAAGATERPVSENDIKQTVSGVGAADIDWDTVLYAAKKREGIPIAIGRR